ncbi:MAG: type VI secretion system membrane subunit TssM [Pseudomonadota bacterium]
MMRAILEFFKKRWVIQLLGVIALSAILWFAIPLFTLENMVLWVRLGAILFLLLLWVINLVWSKLKAKKADQQMMDDISQTESTAPDQSAEELQILNERFDEALSVLKKSHDGGKFSGAQYLYELPWFIIIGPPGSGKTTALINSGLKFPLSERFGKDAIRGVGGTRNCDWWFTDDAVLLDTAGRYTTQDSQESLDSSAWLGFLDLLKKHRKRRPINGILIAVSVSDMLLQTDEERGLHARAIRNRIQELNERLGVRVPVYMTFTKCDLVAGFSEFFEDLGRDDRAQVWGMTFPLDDKMDQAAPVGFFAQEYDALLQRLNDRMIARMHQERDLQRRTQIYGFPQEMASLREPLKNFLDDTFQTSRFENRPLLRGVYFTSGTQEGTPIDRLLGNVAQSFGLDRISLPAFSGRGRSYFIQELFRRIIFPESTLAGTDKKVEMRRAWMQRGAYAGALGLTVLTALAWTTSFTRNQMGIEELENQIETYQAQIPDQPYSTTDFSILLPPLDQLRQAAGVYSEDTPLSMGLGLYQGDKLDPAANAAYRRLLEGRFLYSLAQRLEEHLQNTSQKEFLREALKAYLMLGKTEYLQPESIKLFMSVDWANTLPGESENQNRLLEHLDSLLAGRFKPFPLDQGLINQARFALTEVPFSRQVYASIQKQAAADNRLDFHLNNALGRHGDLVFTRPEGELQAARIAGLYTKKGFYTLFLPQSHDLAKQALSENWVLKDEAASEASEAELQKLLDEVKSLYIEDYIKHWRDLLNDLKIVKLNGLPHAVEVLDVVSGPSSPLRKLLQAVEANTTLSRLPPELIPKIPGRDAVAGAADAASDLSSGAQSQKYRLQALMNAANKAGLSATGDAQEDVAVRQVDETFEKLNLLVQKRGDSPPPVEALIGDLGDLLSFLADLEAAGGSAALDAAKASGGGRDPVKLLRRRAKRLPQPLNSWIYALSERGWNVVLGSSRNELSSILQTDVQPLCKRGIQGRYPFSKKTQREVTLSDFGTFFGPGGSMDSFFQEQIKPFANTNRRPWRWRKPSGHPMGITTGNLRQFERAAHIRDTFFTAGDQPAVAFSLKPSYLDSAISRFMLDLDGQKITYRHGPARTTKMVWPAPDASGRVRIVFEDLNGKIASHTEEGPWAWFRLLDKMDVKDTQQADRFMLSFTVDGHTARFELRASSIINPFSMPELEAFRCPRL